MANQAAYISLAGATRGDIVRVCAFFNDDGEQYRVLLPFINEGLASTEKATVFAQFAGSAAGARLCRTRGNGVWQCHDDAVIFPSHLGQFTGHAIIDIVRTGYGRPEV